MESLTLLDIENMSSKEYRQKLEDPAFRELINQLTKSTTPVPVEEVAPEAPVVAPVVEPVVPVEAPELRYEYQPTDEHNRPLGGRQVIKYRTPDELAEKLSAQNTELIRKLRKVTREQRLGLTADETIPADAQRFDEVIEFGQKTLTADERFQLSQDLNDPEKFTDARDRLLESAIGVPPAILTKMLNDQQMNNLRLMAKQNFDIFVNSSTDFYADEDNAKTLTDWMFKNKLAPTVENFQLASSTLKTAGLLLDAPVVQQVPVPPTPVVVPVEEVKPQLPVVPPSRIAPVEQPQVKRHSQVPSGLNERVSSAAGVPSVDGHSLTLADIDKMSGDTYKAKMKDPSFRNLVDKLEREAAIRRQQQRQV